MNELQTVMAQSGMAIGAAMLLLWLLSLLRRDASIVDPFWGTGFVLAAGAAFVKSDGVPLRRLCVGALVLLWGLRLSIHLLRRNLGHGEDPRYQSLRRRLGRHFWFKSLIFVFLLQGVLLWIVSLPLQVAMAADGPAFPAALDVLGILLFAAGFFFEVVGDLQLSRFRADPASQGKVLDTGLWRYTRHPNYFGDALLWWGLSCFALSTGALWVVLSPALMTFLLMRVSGVPILERGLAKRRHGYADYVARTSAFVPWPPKRS
jgi:steroid 5-alpha reductase family enzyme